MGGDHDRASGPLASAAEDVALRLAAQPEPFDSPLILSLSPLDHARDDPEHVEGSTDEQLAQDRPVEGRASRSGQASAAGDPVPAAAESPGADALSDVLEAVRLTAVAREVGYDSEAAFSRTFKKLTGVAPALWRHRQAPTSHQGRS